MTSGYHSEFNTWFSRVASEVSLGARRRMYGVFAEVFGEPQRVLDVGVTSESVAPEANYFEEMFPFKDRITAVGIEDARHLEAKYPGLRYTAVQPDAPYPFADGAFDVAFSNAVIEHIVDDQARVAFLKEILRVSHSAFITTPNKYFPIEVHTGMPFLHFLAPKTFFKLADAGRISKFYNSQNLRPMTYRQLEQLAQKVGAPYLIKSVSTLGFISNWVLILNPPRQK